MSDIQIFIKDKDNEGEWRDIDEGLLDLSLHDEKVRNKAIDDFVDKLKPKLNEKIKLWTNSDYLVRWFNGSVEEIAEKLKEGGKEEDIKCSAKSEMCEELKEIEQEISEEYQDNSALTFANLLREMCCKIDENYDNPIISPKFLNDTIDNIIIDLLPNTKNGWIPFSKKIPEKNQYVLLQDSYGFITIKQMKIRSDGTIVFLDGNWLSRMEDYKAWQPLPGKYKKEVN